jgi:putative heme-binding domain-containing protein
LKLRFQHVVLMAGLFAVLCAFAGAADETGRVPVDPAAGKTAGAPSRHGEAKQVPAHSGGIEVHPPPGFDLTVFAAPPDVSYVTCLAAAPTGPVFIGIDEDGSLGRKPNKGRIIRAIDSKGAGVADHFNVFTQVDHPRGMIWDDGKLYVLHPPFLTVYDDDNHTGTANRSEDLVTGISNPHMIESRGADHTTNGIRLGIDGWLYIAVGDFGCPHAVGKDGTELTFHYGGILRVRPDGSGLEVYSYGHRNIYDVAIDPLMNVLTRDNTNDGDNWNDRLAYIVPTGYYGYPSRFMHFPGEFINCLADYGGGAPCGSLFLDEPGLPGGLYTVEWGNGQIDHHPLTPAGANFTAGFEKFMNLPRGTDLDVDGQSHLFASSWANGGFDYSRPDVGYVVRLSPKNFTPPAFPEMRGATDGQLLEDLTSPSHVCRLATQREMLRRGDDAVLDAGLEKLIDSTQPLHVRVAAVFTLKLLHGDASDPALARVAATTPELREFALRALIDKKNDPAVASKPFLDALSDGNPRVRLVGAWGLGRLGRKETAASILPLTADPDFLVAHVATNALVSLNAIDVCLNAVEPSTSPQLTAGALHALKQIHDARVVAGLIERIPTLKDPSVRDLAYEALCRLCYREATWDGIQWWGTRPDTSGPYFQNADWEQTATVKAALQNALSHEDPQIVRGLIVNLEKHKIDLPELPDLIAKAAATDAGFQKILVDMLSSLNRPLLPAQQSALHVVASNEKADPDLRANAIRALVRDSGNEGSMDAATDALAPLLNDASVSPDLTNVLDEFIRNPEFSRHLQIFQKLANSGSPAKRELAYAVLLNLANSRLVQGAHKTAAIDAVTTGWSDPKSAVPMLLALARVHADGYDDRVRGMLNDSRPEVARAAALAADKLGLNSAASLGPVIGSMQYEDVVAAVLKMKGDPKLGRELFQRQGCIACHTTTPREPAKGPMLGGIGGRYNVAELCESIMKPSAKIAQGFETQWFKTKSGDVIEGFVVKEGGDQIEVRTPVGVSTIVKTDDIRKRGKRDISMMPEGLVVKLTPADLASLIAYLDSLDGK